jgi:hypothetical protein
MVTFLNKRSVYDGALKQLPVFFVEEKDLVGNNIAAAVSVVQASSGPLGGTFTLSYGHEVTGPIPANATPPKVKAALELLSSIGPNSPQVDEVTRVVSGHSPVRAWSVAFVGQKHVGNLQAIMVVEKGAELFGSYVVTVTELVPGVSRIDGAFTIEGCHFTEMEGDIISLDSNTLNVVLEGSGFADLTEGTLLQIGQEYVGIQRLDSDPSTGISTVVLDSPLSSDLRAVESVQYCAMTNRSVAHNATTLDVQTALSHVFEKDTEIVVTHISRGYHGASSWCVTFLSDLGDVPRLNLLPAELRHASRATVVEKVLGNSLQGSFVLLFESGGLQSSGLMLVEKWGAFMKQQTFFSRRLSGFDDVVCFECTFSYLMPNVDSMGSKGIINAM